MHRDRGPPGHPEGAAGLLHCHAARQGEPAAWHAPHIPVPRVLLHTSPRLDIPLCHPGSLATKLFTEQATDSTTSPRLQIPRLEIPLHTLMELRPRPDGTMEVEFIPVAITTPKEAPSSHVEVPHHLPDPDAPVQVRYGNHAGGITCVWVHEHRTCWGPVHGPACNAGCEWPLINSAVPAHLACLPACNVHPCSLIPWRGTAGHLQVLLAQPPAHVTLRTRPDTLPPLPGCRSLWAAAPRRRSASPAAPTGRASRATCAGRP